MTPRLHQLATGGPRKVKEWIGRTPSTPVPPRVKLRVFERHGGVCHISGRKIRAGEPWECDHVVAIINGGLNRESNLAPALKAKHREKTDADVAEKAWVASVRKKHLGIRESGRGFRKHPTLKRTVDGRVLPRLVKDQRF
jgi:5-methylcytosine-specific restriction endonuclease McrA